MIIGRYFLSGILKEFDNLSHSGYFIGNVSQSRNYKLKKNPLYAGHLVERNKEQFQELRWWLVREEETEMPRNKNVFWIQTQAEMIGTLLLIIQYI